MNVGPNFMLSPFAWLHIGPSPTMSSVVSESVNGFLNTTSVSHSELPRLNSFATPTSISSQSLIALNSTAAEGPRLKLPPGKPHSPAGPRAMTARGSFSSVSAASGVAIKAIVSPRIANFLFIFRAPYRREISIQGLRAGFEALVKLPLPLVSFEKTGVQTARSLRETAGGSIFRAAR